MKLASAFLRDLISQTGWNLDLGVARALQCGDGEFQSFIAELRQPGEREAVVYKTRKLHAAEFAEISEVITRIERAQIKSLVGILGFKVTQVHGCRRLHILLEAMNGTTLEHGHNIHWKNDPAFTDVILGLSRQSRVALAEEAQNTLMRLHEAGLQFPDFKTEQLVIRTDGRLGVLDIDGVILRDGFVARLGLWHSPGLPREPVSTDETDQRRLARVVHELIHGVHPQ